MKSPELTVLLINLVIILIAYLIIYPKAAGSDGNKIAINDLIASAVSLIVVGGIFWNTALEFNALVITLNWFWFTLLTYAAIEIPLMLWYFKKHNVWESFDS